MGNVTDELILFEKIKAGEIKSFEVLFGQYYKALCNFAFLYLKNEEQTEEIVSDVFLNLWTKREEIVIHHSLKAFLYKSTYYAVVSYFRKTKIEFVDNLNEIYKTDMITPETILLKKELNESINNLLNELPKIAGLVFRMKKIDGLKYKEIAEILSISEKTVENHILMAMKKIQKILEIKPELRNQLKN